MKIIVEIDDQDRRDKAESLVEILTRILDFMVHQYSITTEE